MGPAQPRHPIRDLPAEAVGAGAEALVAACTEVPLALRQEDVEVPLIASTDALAAAVVRRALGP